jgi:aspartyl-tRNA(Asn)/glutamyl-tRNA(Gln) amidotransferase subunit A
MTASELVGLFQRREASPVEVANAALARIEASNDKYNALCLVDAERALRDASLGKRVGSRARPKAPSTECRRPSRTSS